MMKLCRKIIIFDTNRIDLVEAQSLIICDNETPMNRYALNQLE